MKSSINYRSCLGIYNKIPLSFGTAPTYLALTLHIVYGLARQFWIVLCES